MNDVQFLSFLRLLLTYWLLRNWHWHWILNAFLYYTAKRKRHFLFYINSYCPLIIFSVLNKITKSKNGPLRSFLSFGQNTIFDEYIFPSIYSPICLHCLIVTRSFSRRLLYWRFLDQGQTIHWTSENKFPISIHMHTWRRLERLFEQLIWERQSDLY